MKRWQKLTFLLLLLIALVWLSTAIFIVQATETAILTRFSRPLPTVFQPGPHFKLPWPVDSVIRFDQRLLVFNFNSATEFLTQDKKNILINSFAVWKIDDQHKFLATVRNRQGAEARLLDIITAAVGEVVGKYALTAFINPAGEQVRLAEINQQITDACTGVARENYGLNIIDVRINSFNFPPQNRASVIKRMQAERDRIATQYRAEGDEEALKIQASTELETRKILAEANREAEIIRGRGEAEAIKIYGAAYRADPEFYRFLRTLEAYNKIIDPNTTIILRSDSELWKMIDRGAP
ncbi:MAG TPA: protease modulator HflC [bacterium]|nr:protease modulator HflC [bacterium]